MKNPLCKTVLGALALLAGLGASAAEPTLKADIVIVGAGASGTAAALASAQQGAKVVLLEKQAAPGGTGNFAEGLFAAESSLQQRQGIVVTKDAAFRMIMEYSHWLANPLLVRAFVDKSPDTIEWLKDQGVTFEYIGPGGPGGILTWHVINGHSRKMLAILREKYAALGGELLLETPGKDLIVEDGKVVGIMAENNQGEKLRVEAKAVIIATGGYANNKEMLKKYARFPEVIPVGNIGKDGDGIKMAWSAGAAPEGMGVMQAYRPGLAGFPPTSHLIAAAVQPFLWVDPKGRRFTDESTVILWPFSGNSVEKVGGTMYSIYDETTRKSLVEGKGIPVPMGEHVLANTRLSKLDADFAKELATGHGNVFKADSIRDLAAQLGMQLETLQATLDENNREADGRQDPVFAKNPNFLRPVRTGPFYATKLHPRSLGTLGGVKIDERTQALNGKGEVIPGLYVTGNDAGGMYGDSYDLLLGGGTLGFAVNSGRIAAENAVRYAGVTLKK